MHFVPATVAVKMPSKTVLFIESFYILMAILVEDLDLLGHTDQSRWYINI